jgi:hypothetical protein
VRIVARRELSPSQTQNSIAENSIPWSLSALAHEPPSPQHDNLQGRGWSASCGFWAGWGPLGPSGFCTEEVGRGGSEWCSQLFILRNLSCVGTVTPSREPIRARGNSGGGGGDVNSYRGNSFPEAKFTGCHARESAGDWKCDTDTWPPVFYLCSEIEADDGFVDRGFRCGG